MIKIKYIPILNKKPPFVKLKTNQQTFCQTKKTSPKMEEKVEIKLSFNKPHHGYQYPKAKSQSLLLHISKRF